MSDYIPELTNVEGVLRRCSTCVHYSIKKVQKRKNLVERWKYGDEQGKSWKSKIKSSEIIEVPDYICLYYNDRITDDKRAIKCRRYKSKAEQSLLTTFIDGEQDIRGFFESLD